MVIKINNSENMALCRHGVVCSTTAIMTDNNINFISIKENFSVFSLFEGANGHVNQLRTICHVNILITR